MSSLPALDRRLAGYALAAGATLAAAQAAIVYTDIDPDQVLTFGDPMPVSYDLNLDHAGLREFEFFLDTNSWGAGPYDYVNRQFELGLMTMPTNAILCPPGTSQARQLNSNYLIGPSASYWFGGAALVGSHFSTISTGGVTSGYGGNFPGKNRRIIGFRFYLSGLN